MTHSRTHFQSQLSILTLILFPLSLTIIRADTTITITGDPANAANGTVTVSGGNGVGVNDPGTPNQPFNLTSGAARIRDNIVDDQFIFGVPTDTLDFVSAEFSGASTRMVLSSPIDWIVDGVAATGSFTELFLADGGATGDDFGFRTGSTLVTGGGSAHLHDL